MAAFGMLSCSQSENALTDITYPTLTDEEARKLILDYYASNYNDSDVMVTIENYGCHIEGLIVKDDTIIKRLSLNPVNRAVYETG